ncbi:uncharacterized protein LOC122922766 isoform X2 [Bufo gargarizans]|uniref:uncharacterized protein LOC122922766 isoform X2 n=1 Tax=Bufo gargarizans TaxID=30331 RepID=UPI001CF3CF6F|nr:uncharacterized protein LOC122922766 isoform X2 [Bufo gargarizans]
MLVLPSFSGRQDPPLETCGAVPVLSSHSLRCTHAASSQRAFTPECADVLVVLLSSPMKQKLPVTQWWTSQAAASPPRQYNIGAISWGTATPMDVIKSRLQADSLYNRKYRGVKDCIKQSYSNEGIFQGNHSKCHTRLSNECCNVFDL